MHYFKDETHCDECQYFDATESTNMFAVLTTKPENLPAGNSAKLCMNLHWSTKDMEKVVDMYNNFENTPLCENGKPGVDVHIWHESAERLNALSCTA